MPSLNVAVIGAGISGLSAAWLLARRHKVTLFERENRIGGHSHTVEVPAPGAGAVPVDAGFIVYNEKSYPNLVALFRHLDVPTVETRMGFAVSLDGGSYEYSGNGLAGLFGQRSNVVRPSHIRMLVDIVRFFREAQRMAASGADDSRSLAQFLSDAGYSAAFVDRHILPMAAAIWSTPSSDVLDFPLQSFVRFFDNHDLLKIADRPLWRTVAGGSREYVKRLCGDFSGRIERGSPVHSISRDGEGVEVRWGDRRERFDACIVATHADEALSLLTDADERERTVLGAFRYTSNRAVMHRDAAFMPRRRRLWSSWNYLGSSAGRERQLSVTYWMNELQTLGTAAGDVFVTLNPQREIAAERIVQTFDFTHPVFDRAAMDAQRAIHALQGRRNTWFAGSYQGYGFHEDGLEAGLWVAEDVGGVERPWTVPAGSSRLPMPPPGRSKPARIEEFAV